MSRSELSNTWPSAVMIVARQRIKNFPNILTHLLKILLQDDANVNLLLKERILLCIACLTLIKQNIIRTTQMYLNESAYLKHNKLESMQEILNIKDTIIISNQCRSNSIMGKVCNLNFCR